MNYIMQKVKYAVCKGGGEWVNCHLSKWGDGSGGEKQSKCGLTREIS